MTQSISKTKLILLLSPAIGFILFFIIVVLVMAILQSFGLYNTVGESKLTLEHWQEVLSNKTTWKFFFYSLRQGIFSALGSIMVAYPLALWLKNSFKGSSVITGILRIPMLIPGLIAAFLFLNIVAFHGIINQFLVRVGFIAEPIRMQNDQYGIGIVILQIWKNTPFALLLLTSSIRGISTEVIDAARDLGAKKITILWKIIFPLTVSVMRAVMIIIFIGAAGDFSFNLVAGPRSLLSLSQYMFVLSKQFFEVNQAAVVTVLLMLASLLGTVFLMLISSIFTRTEKPFQLKGIQNVI